MKPRSAPGLAWFRALGPGTCLKSAQASFFPRDAVPGPMPLLYAIGHERAHTPRFDRVNGCSVPRTRQRSVAPEFCDFRARKRIGQGPNPLCIRKFSFQVISKNFNFINVLQFIYGMHLGQFSQSLRSLGAKGSAENTRLYKFTEGSLSPYFRGDTVSPHEQCSARAAENSSSKIILNILF